MMMVMHLMLGIMMMMTMVTGDVVVVGSFSYRPNVTVAFIARLLAFPTEDKCVEWLTAFEGLAYTEAGASAKQMTVPTKTAFLDCKNSAAAVNF